MDLERLLEADESLRLYQLRLEAAFKRLRGEGLGFLRDLKELGERARAEAAPFPDVYPIYDEAADAVWNEPNQELFDFFGSCRSLVQGHWRYLGHCSERLQASGDRLWLKRGLSAAALGRADPDYRDLLLALDHLLKVARLWELPVEAMLREMASLCQGVAGRGGLSRSMGDFFLMIVDKAKQAGNI